REVAALQSLLLHGAAHERLLKLARAMFCSTQAIRELPLRAAEERVPGRCSWPAARWRSISSRRLGRSRWLWGLEVRRVLTQERVRLDVARDRAVAQPGLCLDGLGSNRHARLVSAAMPCVSRSNVRCACWRALLRAVSRRRSWAVIRSVIRAAPCRRW